MGSVLDLLHIADSAFPVGAHAHSYGLETLVQHGDVADAAALCKLLRVELAVALARTDLVALRWAHEAAAERDLDGLARLDRELTALKPVREWREASIGTGRRFLATARSFLYTPLADASSRPRSPHSYGHTGTTGERFLDELAVLIDTGRLGPHHALAYGVVGQHLGIAVGDLARAYAFGAVAARVSAAVRLIPLGQTAAQQALHALKGDVEAAAHASATHPRDDMGGGMPLVEIAGMLHERAAGRLFIS